MTTIEDCKALVAMSTSCSWLEGSAACPSAGTGIDTPLVEKEGAESEPLEDDESEPLEDDGGCGDRSNPVSRERERERVLLMMIEERRQSFEGVC